MKKALFLLGLLGVIGLIANLTYFSNILTVPAAAASSETKLEKQFNKQGVSFNYPGRWIPWSEEKLKQAKQMVKKGAGVELDLIAMLMPKEENFCMQVSMQVNKSTFDKLYKDKKSVADQVNKKGMEVMQENYLKYNLDVINLPNLGKVIYSQAEKQGGQVGKSYQFLKNGYEYNFNFIYQNTKAADNEKDLQQQIMQSVKIST